MKIEPAELDYMISKLDLIIKKALAFEEKYKEDIDSVHEAYRDSAVNLVHYMALRNQDIRRLQAKLGQLGISTLGRAESHVMATMLAVKNLLLKLASTDQDDGLEARLSFYEGKKRLTVNSEYLLGVHPEGRSVRIMVTLPTEAATNPKLVLLLMQSGMNIARINCAHDDEQTWSEMIENIRTAEKELGITCKICMDLGGPKLRTGPVVKGFKAARFKAKRDEIGKTIRKARVVFGSDIPENSTEIIVQVDADLIDQAEVGDSIRLNDARGRKRRLKVVEKGDGKLIAECSKSVSFATGLKVRLSGKGSDKKLTSLIGNLPRKEQKLFLKVGDVLTLHGRGEPGASAKYGPEGELIRGAHISCTLPRIFKDLRKGEKILFDDGSIEGIIKQVSEESVQIEITFAASEGARLASDKGINLPDSQLSIRGLTEKDKADLPFIAANADIVNLSFVNHPQDIEDLMTELKKLGAQDIGIVLKIETQRSFKNLPRLLLQGMRHYPIGVMIARGDLAIECGWMRLAAIQEEILWLCEAAHIPNIWATQVLENLAKRGIPSRAEITDAAMSQRAECVMLNKGPHINQAISMLDAILKSMQSHQMKKMTMLPSLATSEVFNPL